VTRPTFAFKKSLPREVVGSTITLAPFSKSASHLATIVTEAAAAANSSSPRGTISAQTATSMRRSANSNLSEKHLSSSVNLKISSHSLYVVGEPVQVKRISRLLSGLDV
jgi:hypothetical protein